jgi:beta-lactam-binding protein with PASTA domain
VPDVVGASIDAAEERLASMPLTAEIITRPAHPGERLGRVVDQYPKGGTLSSWDVVRIVVPKATEGTVPRVIGLRAAKAGARLAARGLIAVVDGSTEGRAGVVVGQTPRAHVAADRGMTVSLVVGRG